MRNVFLLLSLFLCISTSPAFAGAGEVPFEEIFQYAARRYHVPYNLLISIAEHESRMKPWAVNIARKSYFPKTKEEALELVRQHPGKSYDLGIMQINVWWFKWLGIAPESIIDPATNIIIGAYILGENIATWGLTWKAVAAYHTPPNKNPQLAEDYAKRIWAIYRRKGS